jgi:hypothetical protein
MDSKLKKSYLSETKTLIRDLASVTRGRITRDYLRPDAGAVIVTSVILTGEQLNSIHTLFASREIQRQNCKAVFLNLWSAMMGQVVRKQT